MSDDTFTYETDELQALRHAHNYYSWIITCFKPYLGSSIAEVGAGIGTFSDFIISNARDPFTLSLYEPADNNYESLHFIYSENKNVKLIKGYFNHETEGKYDTLIANNVLEHIEDDLMFLNDVNKTLSPSGNLLIFVPALQFLYSDFDRALGHFRRYDKNRINKLLKESGFNVIVCRYFNLLGIFTWYAYFKILKNKKLSSSSIKLYDKYFVPVLRKIEQMVEPPLGQSLLVVAQKNN